MEIEVDEKWSWDKKKWIITQVPDVRFTAALRGNKTEREVNKLNLFGQGGIMVFLAVGNL